MGIFDTIGGYVEDLTGINLGGNSSMDRAVGAQQDAARESNALQRYMFDTQRADAQPWREAGVGALGQLQGGDFKRDFTMNDFQADPGYQFRMNEGMKAIERAAAARGGSQSGGTLKALTRFNQDTASQEFGNAYNRFNADRDRRFNRLSSLAGLGQTANSQIAQAGQNYANQYGQNAMGAANAQAAAAAAQSSQRSQLVGQAATAAMMFSDERLKTDIAPIDPADLMELREAIKPCMFRYKHDDLGKGEWIGVLAQDLEKTKLGRKIVSEDENGFKQIDMRKALSLFLATMAEV